MPEPEDIEVISQEYDNGKISAGLSEQPDKLTYLKLEREGELPLVLYLRPDELAAVGFCVNGVLWSVLMGANAQDDEQPRTE